MSDVSIDENAYVMATLPSNCDHDIPAIGFVSHFDTSPDYTGKNVNPQIHENYNRKDIVSDQKECCFISKLF